MVERRRLSCGQIPSLCQTLQMMQALQVPACLTWQVTQIRLTLVGSAGSCLVVPCLRSQICDAVFVFSTLPLRTLLFSPIFWCRSFALRCLCESSAANSSLLMSSVWRACGWSFAHLEPEGRRFRHGGQAETSHSCHISAFCETWLMVAIPVCRESDGSGVDEWCKSITCIHRE